MSTVTVSLFDRRRVSRSSPAASDVTLRPRAGMDDDATQKYAANVAQLVSKARSVIRDLDPTVRPSSLEPHIWRARTPHA